MAKPSKATGKAVGKARATAKRALEGYRGIFRKLAEEHGEVDALLERVKASSEGDSVRDELFPTIRAELLSHARAEEEVFYPALEEFEETRALATHSREDHGKVEGLLDQLKRGDSSDPSWTATFEEMAQSVDNHVNEEEQEVFPRAMRLFSDAQVERLEQRFTRAKDEAKKRIAS